MNPPFTDEENEDENETYLGVMKLDPALIDRFPFIVHVPTWDDLTDKERRAMLSDVYEGEHNIPVSLITLVDKTKEKIEACKTKYGKSFSEYILYLMKFMAEPFGYTSSRRASMLYETLIAIQAANETLLDTVVLIA